VEARKRGQGHVGASMNSEGCHTDPFGVSITQYPSLTDRRLSIYIVSTGCHSVARLGTFQELNGEALHGTQVERSSELGTVKLHEFSLYNKTHTLPHTTIGQ